MGESPLAVLLGFKDDPLSLSEKAKNGALQGARSE
jgi:hypothetical protein